MHIFQKEDDGSTGSGDPPKKKPTRLAIGKPLPDLRLRWPFLLIGYRISGTGLHFCTAVRRNSVGSWMIKLVWFQHQNADSLKSRTAAAKA